MKITILKNLTEEQIDSVCGYVSAISNYEDVVVTTDQMEHVRASIIGQFESIEIDTDNFIDVTATVAELERKLSVTEDALQRIYGSCWQASQSGITVTNGDAALNNKLRGEIQRKETKE